MLWPKKNWYQEFDNEKKFTEKNWTTPATSHKSLTLKGGKNQFQPVMLIKTEIFGSKSSFQGKALNLGGWRFDQLFSSAKQFFSCSRQRHQTSSDLREPLSSSDHGNRTTPTRHCIKTTQKFVSQGSYIYCNKVNFVFQQITSNLF